MKNKKGITLIELIISVSLISVVLVFLFQMFVDVKYSDNRTNYSRANQQNRAIIIKMVQDDFLNYKLVGLTDSYYSNRLVVDFKLGNGVTTTLTVNSNTVTYKSADGTTEKWQLTSGKFNINCAEYKNNKGSKFFFIWFRIPLIFKENNANVIDDLEFSYLGKVTGIENFPDKAGLGDNFDINSCGK